MATPQIPKKNRLNEILAVLAWSASLLLVLSLITYDAFDPSWNVSATHDVYRNSVGRVGAYLADGMFQAFGYAAFLVPIFGVFIGYKKLRSQETESPYIHLIGALLVVLASATLLSFAAPQWIRVANFTSGGTLGMFLQQTLTPAFNVTGSLIVLGVALLLGLLLSTPLSLALAAEAVGKLRLPALRMPSLGKLWPRRKKSSRSRPLAAPDDFEIPVGRARAVTLAGSGEDELDLAEPDEGSQRGTPTISMKVAEPAKTEKAARSGRRNSEFQLPVADFLQQAPERTAIEEGELLERAEQLTQKCGEFDVLGRVEQIHPGPVVTTYEFKPEAGVKYSKLTNLVDDLCLAMRAESIRIDRIPGKNTVGIEVPNLKRDSIFLREIVTSDAFQRSKSLLTLALGKLIHGETYVSDLKKMPHLLIAGATGSGKSVALNSVVCSILYKATPEQVKFIMIDPKRLELGVYEGIPHLLTPIVTDPKRASNALGWAVTEMENRYKKLATLGVRNIDQYNAMVEDNSLETTDEDPAVWMPYIVVIIDELADLMMVAAKEVEESITRLAQMARAVGIHLILATQRPSVDVITGLIKANFPSRISFRVSSKIDSRTILDTNGAEALLGLGDMLFLPPGTSRLTRIHGAYVSEKEIHSIVSFLRKQGDPNYKEEILEERTESEVEGEIGESWNDELYDEAARFIVEIGKASTSMLQRRFRVGYGRAARLIDMMERDGIVGAADGSKPREVLKSPDFYREVEERL